MPTPAIGEWETGAPGQEWYKTGLGQSEWPLVLIPDGGVGLGLRIARLISAETWLRRAMSDNSETPEFTVAMTIALCAWWSVTSPMLALWEAR